MMQAVLMGAVLSQTGLINSEECKYSSQTRAVFLSVINVYDYRRTV